MLVVMLFIFLRVSAITLPLVNMEACYLLEISGLHFACRLPLFSAPLTCLIGRKADFGRWISVAQWSDASRRA
jgi:hypothetical protein